MASTPEIVYRWKDDRSGATEETKNNRPPNGWLELSVSTPGDDDELGNRRRQSYLLSTASAQLFRDWLANK